MGRIEKHNIAELTTGLNFRCRLDVHNGVMERVVSDNTKMMSVIEQTDVAVRISDSISDSQSGLDMDFEIEKAIGGEPKKSKITVWNVSPTTYKRLEKGTKIDFYGAYGKNNYSLISTGTLDAKSQEENKIVSTENTGFLWKDKQASGQSDIPTTIEFFDAGLVLDDAIISKSYKGSIDFKTIVMDILGILGIPVGRFEITTPYSISNYVARGRIGKIFNEIFERLNAHWDITNGFFNCYYDEKEEDAFGIILNGDNSNRPISQENGYKVETKLLPFLNPDTFCKLNFTNVSGVYKITRIKHTGNNYGTQGKTEIWCE